ncbi:MAG: UbiA family prenyltransferase [Vicinamibacterales bacterium]
MTAAAAPALPRRPRWRAYLLLARASNLPTVWSNVLAGLAAGGVAAGWPGPFGPDGRGTLLRLCLGVSLMYTAGMFLNDASDEAFDRQHRPDRPLARGEVTRVEVLTIGGLLLLGGMAVPAWGAAPQSLLWLAALAAAIVYYDQHHKQNPLAPLVMGICRGLVYCVAAAVAGGTVGVQVLVAAAALTAYVAGLTVVARRLGPAGGPAVPWLLAGISLVDALVVLAFGGGPWLAGVTALGFPLTLAFQRVVPGT